MVYIYDELTTILFGPCQYLPARGQGARFRLVIFPGRVQAAWDLDKLRQIRRLGKVTRLIIFPLAANLYTDHDAPHTHTGTSLFEEGAHTHTGVSGAAQELKRR